MCLLNTAERRLHQTIRRSRDNAILSLSFGTRDSKSCLNKGADEEIDHSGWAWPGQGFPINQGVALVFLQNLQSVGTSQCARRLNQKEVMPAETKDFFQYLRRIESSLWFKHPTPAVLDPNKQIGLAIMVSRSLESDGGMLPWRHPNSCAWC